MQAVAFQLISQFFNQRLHRFGSSEVRDIQPADHQIYLSRHGVIELHCDRVVTRDTAFTSPWRKLLLQLRAQLRQMNHRDSPMGWLATPSTETVWNG